MANVRRRNSVPGNRGELFMQSFLAALLSAHLRDERFVHAGRRSDWFKQVGLEPLAVWCQTLQSGRRLLVHTGLARSACASGFKRYSQAMVPAPAEERFA